MASLVEPLRVLDLALAQDAVAADDAMTVKEVKDATLRQSVALSQCTGAPTVSDLPAWLAMVPEELLAARQCLLQPPYTNGDFEYRSRKFHFPMHCDPSSNRSRSSRSRVLPASVTSLPGDGLSVMFS